MNTGQLNKSLTIIKKPSKSFTIRVMLRFYNAQMAEMDRTIFPDIQYLKHEFPFFLFCNYDFNSGYTEGLKFFNLRWLAVINNLPPQFHLDSYFNLGKMETLSYIDGFTNETLIQSQLAYKYGIGTIIQLYAPCVFAPPPATRPKYAAIIYQFIDHGYNSILQDTNNKNFKIEAINLFCQNNQQFNNALFFVDLKEPNFFKNDQVNPLMFKTKDYGLDNFIYMPVNFNLNRYTGIYGLLKYETEFIDFEFKYKS